MRHFEKVLFSAAIVIGLPIFCGILMAAPQQATRQTAKPANLKVSRQKKNQVTTIDQAVYRQKSQQLQAQIREDKKKLKTDKVRLGNNNPSVKADRAQLRKNEKALKQLQKAHKKGRKK